MASQFITWSNYRSLRSLGSHTLGLPWHRSRSPAPQRSPGMTMQNGIRSNFIPKWHVLSASCFSTHKRKLPKTSTATSTPAWTKHPFFICHHLQCNKWSQHLPASLQVSSPSRCILMGLVNPSMEVKTSDWGEPDNHGGWGFLGMLSPFMHM